MTTASAVRVLVTGGTGLIGRALVARLLDDGYSVRVLARRLSNTAGLEAMGAEVLRGDVTDRESFGAAMAGARTVVHLAAGTNDAGSDAWTATVEGTRHLLALAEAHRPLRLVYVSSCSVYGVTDYAEGTVVTEDAPLERHPHRRGQYSAAKLEAERLVTARMQAGGVPTVVLRPGTVYGPGADLFPAILGVSTGSIAVVLGDGGSVLPYVYLDNVVEAIVRAMTHAEAPGQVFNVVDPEPLTKRRYVDAVFRRVRPDALVVYLPLVIVTVLVAVLEAAFGAVGRRPPLTRYRVAASQRRIVYDSGRIMARLGWRPVVALADALDRLVASALEPGVRHDGGDVADIRVRTAGR